MTAKTTARVTARVRDNESGEYEIRKVEVEARTTNVPGLVLTRPLDNGRVQTRGWIITHERSGYSVIPAPYERLSDARAAAADLRDATDWTKSRSELYRQRVRLARLVRGVAPRSTS